MEKNLSLLRPFDLEKAKAGEPICSSREGEFRKFIAGPDATGCIVVAYSDGKFAICPISYYAMAPLAWVEGKPVYAGDVLYGKNDIYESRHPNGVEIVGIHTNGNLQCISVGDGRESVSGYKTDHAFTWNKPKVKKSGWVNVYPSTFNVSGRACGGIIYTSKEQAIDTNFSDDIITTIQIEWEEQQ